MFLWITQSPFRSQIVFQGETNFAFYLIISEIASQIQIETKITPGELYPILETISKNDIEVILIKNPNEPEDKFISIFPIADDDLNYQIANFRPQEYKNIKIGVIKNLNKCLKRNKSKTGLAKLRKGIGKVSEQDKSWDLILKQLNTYYPLYTETEETIQKGENLKKVFGVFPKNDVDVFAF